MSTTCPGGRRVFLFFQAEDGIRDLYVTGVQTCALPIYTSLFLSSRRRHTRSLRDWSSDVFFFFSSRRRHTRSLRDWSSDVCSSDLKQKTAYESLRDWSSDVCSSDLSSQAEDGIRDLYVTGEHTSELQSRRDLVCRLLLDWSSVVCSRSEEHTSELQSRRDVVCRLLLDN